MEGSQSASVKQRKVAAGQEASPPGGRSAVRGLRIGLARAARDIFEMPVAVIGATQTRCAQASLGQYLGKDHLLVLLDGPDRQVGVLSVDRESLASIIQQQTMGRVTGGEPAARPYTSTDAALVAPLIDETMKRAAAMTDVLTDRRCLEGYRFGARTEDLRSMILAIEAERFRIFNLTLDFAAGVQQGKWCLALPEPEEEPAAASAAPLGPRLDKPAGAARAELSAVIGRLRLPLAEFSAMKPGALLPLQNPQIDRADLVAINGQRIATARLGQISGMRAVRLNELSPKRPARGDGQFQIGSLPQPESGADMTVDMPSLPDLPDPSAMPDLPDLPKMGFPNPMGDSDDAAPMPLDLGGLPSLGEDEDEPLPNLNPRQAAMQISELAGLSLDGESEV